MSVLREYAGFVGAGRAAGHTRRPLLVHVVLVLIGVTADGAHPVHRHVGELFHYLASFRALAAATDALRMSARSTGAGSAWRSVSSIAMPAVLLATSSLMASV